MDLEKDFEDGFFDSGYGRMHYKRHAGSGPAVVFIHGLAGSVRTWTRLMRYMEEGMDVCLIDMLGHGDSEMPDIDYTLKIHYESVNGLIENLGLGGYFVFGHSYGGWLAAYIAMQNRIDGLILEDASGLENFYKERSEFNPDYKEEIIRKAMKLNPHEKMLRSMFDADNSEELLTSANLGAIDSKALIIWGENDVTVDPKYAQYFKRYIKGSRLEIIRGGRHTPHYTNPEEVARLILRFVSRGSSIV
ncbi:MAG: alpha/beta hydrolase [Candidatus Marsarchaeota archaeon]|nr:alpha/beta hydrolase [Candidatus Marsarchaeota archaeon]MCL5413331.1 alpha/beta hydrolase [Candidatus Marsarchaeota archaeon]